jgi:hypothetical protein
MWGCEGKSQHTEHVPSILAALVRGWPVAVPLPLARLALVLQLLLLPLRCHNLPLVLACLGLGRLLGLGGLLLFLLGAVLDELLLEAT